MRTQNKGTRSSHSRITTIAIAVASSFAMTPAWAAPATNLPGNGVGIAIGSGSNAPKAENVAIGKSAIIKYSNGDTDAVNLSWLKKSVTKVESASQGYIDITTTRKENALTNTTIYSVGLSPYAKSGIDNSNTYLGPDGIDANGKKITGVAAGAADTDAVNVAQLNKAAAAATTTVATTDSNLTVAETPSGSHNYQVGLNKTLTGMQSAEFTNATGTEQARISQAGVVITKDSTTVSLTATGLDNGGQTITNVYAGSNDTDAVNVRQLKDSRSKVETAQPTYVQIQTSRENPTTNSGATIYSVGLSPYR